MQTIAFDSLDQLPADIANAIRSDGRPAGSIPSDILLHEEMSDGRLVVIELCDLGSDRWDALLS